MNSLALHHFRKEFRYQLPRWLPWLLLLALLLAVELEWIQSLGDGGHPARDPQWVGWLRYAVRGLGFWLAAACAPEDLPGKPSRFLAARPLSLSSYLTGRALAFLALVVAPLMVWEALYLLLSARPVGEALLGGAESAIAAILIYGWVLPFGLLWRSGGQWLLSLGIAAVGLVATMPVLYLLQFRLTNPLAFHIGSFRMYLSEESGPRLFLLLVLFAIMLWFLAWRHLRVEWPVWRRVTALLLGVIGACAMFFRQQHMPLPAMRATAQGEVDAMAQKVSPQVSQARLKVMPDAMVKLTPPYEFARVARSSLQVQTPDIPHVSLHWRARRLEIAWEGETRTGYIAPAVPAAAFVSDWRRQNTETSRTIAVLFPKGTLLRWGNMDHLYPGTVGSAYWAPESWREEAATRPVIRGELEACWVRWTLAGEMPVVKSATLDLGDARWEIQEVRPDAQADGTSMQGSLAIGVRVQHRESHRDATPWPWHAHLIPVLYSPAKGIAWVRQINESLDQGNIPLTTLGERGVFTGWVRTRGRFAWPGVLEPLAGVSPDQLPELRLAVLRREFMGTSQMQFSTDHVEVEEPRKTHYPANSMQEADAITARISRLPDLREGATEAEAAALVASVFEAVPEGLTGTRPGVEKLRAVARQHPALLLRLDLSRDWEGILTSLSNEFREEQRDVLIDHIPHADWVAKVVMDRGWTSEAKRVADRLLATRTYLPHHVENLFWEWRDPAHLPGLLRIFRSNPSIRSFKNLAKFPQSDAALRDCSVEWMSHAKPTMEKWLADQLDELTCALAGGNADALATFLHVIRNMSRAERRTLTRWVMDQVAGIFDFVADGGGKPDSEAILEALSKATPESFRFDAQRRVWLRRNP